jgi:hypothetical protein
MRIEANSPDEYLEKLTDDRKEVMSNLREVIQTNLPAMDFTKK